MRRGVRQERRFACRRGCAAGGALWEIVRHVLVWYFQKLSVVNVAYGSLATTIIVLLTLETAALILLLGAQLIAELERLSDLEASAVAEPPPPGA